MEQAFKQAEFYDSVENLPFSAFTYELSGSLWHWHNYLELLYGLEGEYLVMVGNKRFHCQRGDFIMVNASEPHATVRAREKSCLLVIQFDLSVIYSPLSAQYEGKYLSSLLQSDVHFQRHVHLTEESPLHVLLDDVYKEHSQKRVGYELSVKAGIIRIFVQMLRSKLFDTDNGPYKRHEDLSRLEPVFLFVQEHFMDDISQEEMAQKVYMSTSYFCKLFKRATGMRFVDYVHTVRIHEAQKQILSTNKKLAQVSTECGFGNITYFNRIFKRISGMTPSAYRLQNRISSSDLSSSN